jgi:hypothetical protein
VRGRRKITLAILWHRFCRGRRMGICIRCRYWFILVCMIVEVLDSCISHCRQAIPLLSVYQSTRAISKPNAITTGARGLFNLEYQMRDSERAHAITIYEYITRVNCDHAQVAIASAKRPPENPRTPTCRTSSQT